LTASGSRTYWESVGRSSRHQDVHNPSPFAQCMWSPDVDTCQRSENLQSARQRNVFLFVHLQTIINEYNVHVQSLNGQITFNLHLVSKNVPPLDCYNLDSCERMLIIFSRNVTNKLSNQNTLYYATSNTLCFCITW